MKKINNPIHPIKKKPSWIRSKIINSQNYFKTKDIINQFFPNVKIRRELGEYEAILSNKKIKDKLGFLPKHDWRNYCNIN